MTPAGIRLPRRIPAGEPLSGICHLDEGGAVVACNGAVEELFGYAGWELVGLRLQSLVEGPDTAAEGAAESPPIPWPPHVTGRWLRVVGLRKDGGRFEAELAYEPAPQGGPSGGGCRHLALIRDRREGADVESLLHIQATALESAANAIVLTDAKGHILWVNSAFSRLTGYSPEEAVGKTPRILKSGVHGQEFFEDLWRTVLTGQVWQGLTVNRKKDGTRYIEEQTITPVRDRYGNITHFVAIKNDVTRRKEAEDSLARRTRDLAERVKELRCLYAISELARDLELSRERLLEGVAKLLPPGFSVPEATSARIVWGGVEYRSEPFAEAPHRLAKEIAVRGEVEGLLEVFAAPSEGGSAGAFLPEEEELVGAVVSLLGTNTERRRAAEDLRRSEEQYRLVVENVQEVIFRCDAGGRWVFLNPAWTALTGYSLEEVLGKAFDQYVCPEDRDRGLEVFRLLQEGGGATENLEIRLRAKSGEVRWFEVVAARLSDSEGRFAGASGTLTDITRRKEVDRLKSEFVSTVSHELRTPLTSIRGSLGLLVGGVGGALSPQAEELCDIALRNCERLGLLINDLLDTEKIESGKMAFSTRTEELMPIVEQALDGTSAYAAQFGVVFWIAGSLPAAKVRVDPNRLTQVLTNLLSNAAKFSPPDSAVEVSVEKAGEMVRVSVRDRGPGIPEDFRPRLFQKFAQADGSDARRKGGTGLGLSISKAIVERLGGRLDYESVVGEGTTFFFELPLVEVDHGS